MLPKDDQGIKTLIKRHNGEIERQVGKTPQRWHFSGNLGNRERAEGPGRGRLVQGLRAPTEL